MQVKDGMIESVLGIHATESLVQATTSMLRSHVGALSVVGGDNSLVGIMTEGDLLEHRELSKQKRRPRWVEFLFGECVRAVVHLHADGPNRDETESQGVISIAETASLREAVDLMSQHNIKQLPIMVADRVVGIFVRAGLLGVLKVLLPAWEHAPNHAEIRGSILADLDRQNKATYKSVRAPNSG